jgi:hypothetical protein
MECAALVTSVPVAVPQVIPEKMCAFVQFDTHETAEKAKKSPRPVCGNRFIKVVWAQHDPENPEGVDDALIDAVEVPADAAGAADAAEPATPTAATPVGAVSPTTIATKEVRLCITTCD